MIQRFAKVALSIVIVLNIYCTDHKRQISYPEISQQSEGKFVLEEIDGEIYRVRDGSWNFRYSNNNIHKRGVYNRGDPVGVWEFWYKNGQKMKDIEYGKNNAGIRILNYFHLNGDTMILDGDGKLIEYYPNGNKKQVGYVKNGMETGLWEYWYQNGQKRKAITFANTKEKTPYLEWDSLGNKVTEGYFCGKHRCGIWTSWYSNGFESESGEYLAGFKQGPWVYMHENGKVSSRGNYQEGYKMGRWVDYSIEELITAEGSYSDCKVLSKDSLIEFDSILNQTNLVIMESEECKDKVWKYYNKSGKLIKREIYTKGKLVETTKH